MAKPWMLTRAATTRRCCTRVESKDALLAVSRASAATDLRKTAVRAAVRWFMGLTNEKAPAEGRTERWMALMVVRR